MSPSCRRRSVLTWLFLSSCMSCSCWRISVLSLPWSRSQAVRLLVFARQPATVGFTLSIFGSGPHVSSVRILSRPAVTDQRPSDPSCESTQCHRFHTDCLEVRQALLEHGDEAARSGVELVPANLLFLLCRFSGHLLDEDSVVRFCVENADSCLLRIASARESAGHRTIWEAPHLHDSAYPARSPFAEGCSDRHQVLQDGELCPLISSMRIVLFGLSSSRSGLRVALLGLAWGRSREVCLLISVSLLAAIGPNQTRGSINSVLREVWRARIER